MVTSSLRIILQIYGDVIVMDTPSILWWRHRYGYSFNSMVTSSLWILLQFYGNVIVMDNPSNLWWRHRFGYSFNSMVTSSLWILLQFYGDIIVMDNASILWWRHHYGYSSNSTVTSSLWILLQLYGDVILMDTPSTLWWLHRYEYSFNCMVTSSLWILNTQQSSGDWETNCQLRREATRYLLNTEYPVRVNAFVFCSRGTSTAAECVLSVTSNVWSRDSKLYRNANKSVVWQATSVLTKWKLTQELQQKYAWTV